MFDWLRYRYHLLRLRREHKKEYREDYWQEYIKKLKEYKNEQQRLGRDFNTIMEQTGSQNEIVELYEKATGPTRVYRARVNSLESHYLNDIAEKYSLSVPSWDKWLPSQYTSEFYLSDDERRKLRIEIRAYRRERLDIARSWLTSITGLLGALIGLLAVILHKR